MTTEQARLKFPEETILLSEDELKAYCMVSEVLSDMFINFIKRPKEVLDNGTKN